MRNGVILCINYWSLSSWWYKFIYDYDCYQELTLRMANNRMPKGCDNSCHPVISGDVFIGPASSSSCLEGCFREFRHILRLCGHISNKIYTMLLKESMARNGQEL